MKIIQKALFREKFRKWGRGQSPFRMSSENSSVLVAWPFPKTHLSFAAKLLNTWGSGAEQLLSSNRSSSKVWHISTKCYSWKVCWWHQKFLKVFTATEKWTRWDFIIFWTRYLEITDWRILTWQWIRPSPPAQVWINNHYKIGYSRFAFSIRRQSPNNLLRCRLPSSHRFNSFIHECM